MEPQLNKFALVFAVCFFILSTVIIPQAAYAESMDQILGNVIQAADSLMRGDYQSAVQRAVPNVNRDFARNTNVQLNGNTVRAQQNIAPGFAQNGFMNVGATVGAQSQLHLNQRPTFIPNSQINTHTKYFSNTTQIRKP